MTGTLSGCNLFENDYEPDLPYRKLLCAMIKQAYFHARGVELDADGKPTKLREETMKATAVEYLMSADFPADCEDLDLPCDIDYFVERVRAKIGEETYQMSAFNKVTEDDKQAIRKEYIPKITTQSEIAQRYGISTRYVRNIISVAER